MESDANHTTQYDRDVARGVVIGLIAAFQNHTEGLVDILAGAIAEARQNGYERGWADAQDCAYE